MSRIVADDALDWTRSAMQARLLSSIFSSSIHRFVLKGGMAMKIRHAQARATQDIDLDSDRDWDLFDMQETMRNAIQQAIETTMLEDTVVTEPKQTDTTARWRIRGRDQRTQQYLTLTVEVSRRDCIVDADKETLPYCHAEGETPVVVYTNQILAFKKIKALLSPMREAPRDVTDLFLLIQGQVDPPRQAVRDWCLQQGHTPDQLVALLWDKLDSMDQTRFKQEVLPSLPATPQSQQWFSDWDRVRLQVGCVVEAWIQEAFDDSTPTPLDAQCLRRKHATSNDTPNTPVTVMT